MGISFERLFDLAVSHEWYGQATPIAITPCADTTRALRYARCRVETQDAQTSVWRGDDGRSIPAHTMGGHPLLFGLAAEDPAFFAATETDWDGGWPPNHTLVFTSSAFQDGAAPSFKAVSVPIRPPEFTHNFATATNETVAIVHGQNGAVVWSSPPVTTARQSCHVDLIDQPEGRYDIVVGDQPPVSFMLLRASQAPAAIIEIDAAYMVAKGTSGTPVSFAIMFKARKLPWIYRVFPPATAILNDATISGGGFGGPVEEIASGRRAFAFTSRNPLPLGAGPFTLSCRSGDFTPITLPSAGPSAIHQRGPERALSFQMNVLL